MSANWTHVFSFGNLNSLFSVQKIWNALRETLSKQNFKNIAPKLVQNTLRHFGRPLKAIFEILKFFRFFWKFSKARPSMEQWEKTFLSKKSPKTRLDTWERFGQFKNFEIVLIFFLSLFYVSTSNFKSGKPNSNLFSPENWPLIFKSRKSEKPCMEHWAKKFGKIASKHVQNTFGHFWKRLWALLEFWKFFDLFAIFRKPDPPWNTGHFFSKKMPQNTFGHMETFLDIFGTLKLFWFFSLIFV